MTERVNRDGTDPNFPIGGLEITPSYQKYSKDEDGSEEWRRDNEEDIRQFGIAGRIWEATYLMTKYLSRPAEGGTEYDPPCTLFSGTTTIECIIELGAGAGIVGIHLALQLETLKDIKSNIILTDLENVMPLIDRNIQKTRIHSSIQSAALPWGSKVHADKIQKDFSNRISHIICSDLVYFPELLAPLLRSLIHLTTGCKDPPEIIIGYKIRSYTKEEPFWKAFGVWFDFHPVLCRRKGEEESRRFGSLAKDCGQIVEEDDDTLAEDEMFVFIAHRRLGTLDCEMPSNDEELLGGWLHRQGKLVRGEGGDTFELLLMNSMQTDL